MTQDENSVAVKLLKQAVALDPTFALAASVLSNALLYRAAFGWSAKADLEGEAVHFARLSLSGDKDNSENLARYGLAIAFFLGQYPEAIAVVRRAVDLNPNSSLAWRASGYVHLWDKQAAVALEHFGRALRLSPRDPFDYLGLTGQAIALVELERDDEAIETARQAVQRSPNYVFAWAALSASLALVGRMTEARVAFAEHQRLAPGTTLGKISRAPQPTMHAASRLLGGLCQAGMPE